MSSYCVYCKGVTDSVPNSMHVVKTHNNRNMLRSKCSVCGTEKCKFLPNSYNGPTHGAGILDFIISHPKIVDGALKAAAAIPLAAGYAFAGKKIYDAVNG